MRLLAVLALAATACGGAVGATPTPGTPLPIAELKYRVMDAGGRIEFCDPDFYPVARADEDQLAKQRIGDIQKDAETYDAITKRVGTDTLKVYREWKALNALQLRPLQRIDGPRGPTTWSFGYRTGSTSAGQSPGPTQLWRQVEGIVDVFGKVDITKNVNAGGVPCPICLALGTRIATPSGDVPVEELRIGDAVWTLDASGTRVAAHLSDVGRTPVPATHEVVRLALADGRVVWASPGHALADGRRLGDVRAGDTVDGALVIAADRERYASGFTFDVLPDGASGAYWANDVPLLSTLR